MRLLGLSLDEPHPRLALVLDGVGRLVRRRVLREIAEVALGQRDDLVVTHVATGGDHQPARPVVALPEVDHRLSVDPADGLLGAGDRATDRLVAPHHLVDHVVDELFRGVLSGADLLEDDQALLVELGGVDRRVAHDVGQDVVPGREVRRRRLEPVARTLAAMSPR